MCLSTTLTMLLSPTAAAIDKGIVSEDLVNGEDEQRAVVGHAGPVMRFVVSRRGAATRTKLPVATFNAAVTVSQ